ncbi:MAG TPA: serine protease [Thermoanaerobaculia bacterium]|nr:serine protease [Thermoanaerobaculia bacterium]
MDVALASPMEDERIRYQLARAIASLGPPAPDFVAAQRALQDPRPVLARGISRLAAQRFVEALADFGLAGIVERGGTLAPQGPFGARRLALMAVVAVVAGGGIFLFTLRRGSSPAPAASPQSPSPVSTARSLPWPNNSSPLSVKDLRELAAPAVVEVRSGDHRGIGFFVARDLVLTTTQATQGSPLEVSGGKQGTLKAQVTAQDGRLGLAVLRVAGAIDEPLRLGDATALHPGERILFSRLEPGGPVLREARLGTTGRQLGGVAYLALDGEVQPFDTGAPVLDEHGYVMGVVFFRAEAADQPFLLPINYAYEETRLLERPVPAPNLKKWRTLLAEIEAAEKLRVEQPSLAQPSEAAPPPEPSPSPSPSTR